MLLTKHEPYSKVAYKLLDKLSGQCWKFGLPEDSQGFYLELVDPTCVVMILIQNEPRSLQDEHS